MQPHIDTGVAEPRSRPMHHSPFALRKEIAQHLRDMQEKRVEPSTVEEKTGQGGQELPSPPLKKIISSA